MVCPPPAAEAQPTSVQYIHMTLHSMRHFGVHVVPEPGVQNVFHVPQGRYAWSGEGNVVVEADASSATYFGAVAALTGRSVTLLGVGTSSTQGACFVGRPSTP